MILREEKRDLDQPEHINMDQEWKTNIIDNHEPIDYLDHGFVRYIDHLGSDLRIVETARTCYNSPSKGPDQDRKLLRYLFTHRHTSPFELCSVTFNIKLPIFVMRQFVRHRTFRLNEMSARYTKLPQDFYIPTLWRSQDTKNKQGSQYNSELPHQELTESVTNFCDSAYQLYESLIHTGVAREQARMVLPVNIYTEIYVDCDIHNLLHFLYLRSDNHAQLEMQELAHILLDIVEHLFPWTIEIWRELVPKMVQRDDI